VDGGFDLVAFHRSPPSRSSCTMTLPTR
jgi:hypothetical protein